jgi:hypothetical protein
MAGVISENYLSRKFTLGNQAGRELVFDIVGTNDEAEVRTLILGTAPGGYLGLAIEAVDAEPLGGNVWKGYARYVRIIDDDEYTFDTGGGTQRITQSLETINSYAPSGLTAPDFGGAIGVSDDRVEGVDVTIPAYQFTETHRIAAATVDTSYRVALAGLTGRYNNDTFRGFAAGEVVFKGAAGTKRAGDDFWSITFRFEVSANVSGLSIGGMTIDKLGQHYLWVRYADYADTAASALVKRPVAAYVERVSEPGDFSTLGI